MKPSSSLLAAAGLLLTITVLNLSPLRPAYARFQGDLESRVAALEARADADEAAIAALQAQLSTDEATIADQQTQITNLQAAVANAQNTANTALATANTSADKLLFVSRIGTDMVISGANLRINNGLDKTDSKNGLGNLIVGYNELRGNGNDRTGSHYLVVGAQNNYTSWGGLVAGSYNTASGNFASVSGGFSNIASGQFSSVSGGYINTASVDSSSVSRGQSNSPIGPNSSVSGGAFSIASSLLASVSGGYLNTASGQYASVGGGSNRRAINQSNWVAGGLFQHN